MYSSGVDNEMNLDIFALEAIRCWRYFDAKQNSYCKAFCSNAIAMVKPRSTAATEPTPGEIGWQVLPHLFHSCSEWYEPSMQKPRLGFQSEPWKQPVSPCGQKCNDLQWEPCPNSLMPWCLESTRCSRICDQGALFGPIEPLRSVQRGCWGDGSELLERSFKNRPSTTNRTK